MKRRDFLKAVGAAAVGEAAIVESKPDMIRGVKRKSFQVPVHQYELGGMSDSGDICGSEEHL